MKGINPYRFTNVVFACLVLYRLPKLVTNGISLTGTKFLFFMIGVGVYYMGMIPIAEYFTGQKTITGWSSYGFKKLNRSDHFWVMLQLFASLLALFSGVLAILSF